MPFEELPSFFPKPARFADTRIQLPSEYDEDFAEELGPDNPAPVEIKQFGTESIAVSGRLYKTPLVEVPGITAADALDINDQMGSIFWFWVPRQGTIVKGMFFDLVDEGLGKELWLFNRKVTLAASDAAFALSDADNFAVEAVLTFSAFKDAANNQVSFSADPPQWYEAPQGRLWAAVKTLGADAYGPQKPLGSMSLAKPSTPSQMNRSSSGRKRTST